MIKLTIVCAIFILFYLVAVYNILKVKYNLLIIVIYLDLLLLLGLLQFLLVFSITMSPLDVLLALLVLVIGVCETSVGLGLVAQLRHTSGDRSAVYAPFIK